MNLIQSGFYFFKIVTLAISYFSVKLVIKLNFFIKYIRINHNMYKVLPIYTHRINT